MSDWWNLFNLFIFCWLMFDNFYWRKHQADKYYDNFIKELMAEMDKHDVTIYITPDKKVIKTNKEVIV